ncbi:unnamed protein product [Gongylonema pulchrum]|uniref:SURF6 domain-containing protein n=1 Tax=Gongylonema pulchrum TaxID=637853 RepID=A0A183CXW8_9BILA|nr:unnamed protein product [Gongylonema pulchrum]
MISRLPTDDGPPEVKRPKLDAGSNSIQDGKQRDAKLIFSKFDFIVRPEKPKETKKEKRDKFTGKDYKRLLEKAEKRDERLSEIRAKNPGKADKIENNIQWKKAMNRVEGNKDNPELLKKSLNKKEKLKEWRKKKWEKRVEHTKQMQARQQEKRRANIQARKDAVKKKKLQKARKKGRIL